MTIREPHPGDIPPILALWNQEIREGLATFTTVEKSEADIATLIKGPCLVAEVAGGFAGFGSFGPFRPGSGYAHTCEHAIYLVKDAHGQGLGRAMLAALEAQAKEAGIHVMVAGISSANQGAVGFHEACGFEHAGQVQEAGRKWDQWLDLILMQKRLTD